MSQVQPLHARQENDYNKYFVNDPHLIKEGVHIPINSTCCGKNVTGAKVKIFHKLESHLVRRAVVILLCIDVVCVFFEIIFGYRILPPTGYPDSDAASLYVPRDYVCSDRVRNTENLENCCERHLKEYGSSAGFENKDACFAAHNGTSVHVRRLLLSAEGGHHFDPKRRCYERPVKYTAHHDHAPVEVILHWVSYAILILFCIELALAVFAFGVKQFFCSCYKKYKVGDTVSIIDPNPKDNIPAVGTVTHVNIFNGDIDLEFRENDGTKSTVTDMPICMLSPVDTKEKYTWHHGSHVLDFIVVYISFTMETVNMLETQREGSLINPVHFLLLFRLLRFVRVFHGLYEGTHHMETHIRELKEFEFDTHCYVKRLNDELLRLKKIGDQSVLNLDSTPAEELRRALRHIVVLTKDFERNLLEEEEGHEDEHGKGQGEEHGSGAHHH